MMSTTHAAMGVALTTLLAPVAPEIAPIAALGAIAGGVFPDLDVVDIVGEHRKTLHFPEHYWLVALPAAGVAALSPSSITVGVAGFFVSAAVHSVTDAVGGGLGLRPWLGDDERGVYSHYRKQWIRPRRWIRYDGAPEDLLAVVVLSLPGLLVFDGWVRRLMLAGIIASAIYTAVRKQLPDFAPEFLT